MISQCRMQDINWKVSFNFSEPWLEEVSCFFTFEIDTEFEGERSSFFSFFLSFWWMFILPSHPFCYGGLILKGTAVPTMRSAASCKSSRLQGVRGGAFGVHFTPSLLPLPPFNSPLAGSAFYVLEKWKNGSILPIPNLPWSLCSFHKGQEQCEWQSSFDCDVLLMKLEVIHGQV